METHLELQNLKLNYTSDFTKKLAVAQGKRIIDDLIESGEVGKLEFMANLSRLKWVIDSAETELRNNLELFSTEVVNGVTFTHVNGGETLNYKDDPIYLDLFNQLKEREELLKSAYKLQDVTYMYDSEGIEVPKVSSTPRKSSITITTK